MLYRKVKGVNMQEMSLINKADWIASRAHSGQLDKGGEPYMIHVLSVMARVRTEDQKIIAALHDVLEDAPEYENEILKVGFSSNVISGLKAITKKKHEKYMDYIERVIEHEDATLVKIEDLSVNLDVLRLNRELTPEDLPRLNKYIKACDYLLDTSNYSLGASRDYTMRLNYGYSNPNYDAMSTHML